MEPVRKLPLPSCLPAGRQGRGFGRGRTARAGLGLSDWFERWFQDPFALALGAVIAVYLTAVVLDGAPVQTAA